MSTLRLDLTNATGLDSRNLVVALRKCRFAGTFPCNAKRDLREAYLTSDHYRAVRTPATPLRDGIKVSND